MKRHLIIDLLLTTILFTSCHISEGYKNASIFTFNDFEITKKLNAATIEFDEPIMLAWLFVKSDSLLIVHNLKSNNMLYVYNINTRKKIGEFISFGNGPDDLLSIRNMHLFGSYLYIADGQKRSIYKYDINDFHTLTDNLIPKQKVTIDEYFSNLVYLRNNFAATISNPNDDKRFAFYDLNGEKEFTAGEYPFFGKELTNFEKMEAFRPVIAVSHEYQRIYLFGLTTDFIEIYDFQGELIKIMHGPEQIFPKVEENHTTDGIVRLSTAGSKFAFSCPIIVDDEIYVSYSGNYYEIEKQNVIRQQILVFDMDCNPLRRYELSKPIVSFTVDTETKNIYAISNTPDYHMVVFEQ